MATGSLDANGIWLYGEDDSEPTHSALLNKLGTSVSDTVTRLEQFTGFTGTVPTTNLPTVPTSKGGTGATTIATAQDNLAIGAVKMTPTSVSTGGSATVTNGIVTFSGAAFVILNGVFTGDFSTYRIYVRTLIGSSTGEIYYRNSASGTPSTTGYFNRGLRSGGGTGLTSWAYGDNVGQLPVNAWNQGWSTHTYTNIDVNSPANASLPTLVTSIGNGQEVSAQHALYVMSTGHYVNAAYDGFYIGTSTGTQMAGEIAVYGWN